MVLVVLVVCGGVNDVGVGGVNGVLDCIGVVVLLVMA